MGGSLFAGLVAALVSLPALAQKAPVPDPRLEQRVNQLLIAEINRSVQFERTIPRPASLLAPRPEPVVEERDMVRAADGLYIERSLMPRGALTDGAGAVRVFPRDAR
jgi:hypothetical protein